MLQVINYYLCSQSDYKKEQQAQTGLLKNGNRARTKGGRRHLHHQEVQRRHHLEIQHRKQRVRYMQERHHGPLHNMPKR